MADDYMRHGSIKVLPGVSEIRLVRSFPHAPNLVWAALSEPEQFRHWLAPGTLDHHEGGFVKLRFPDSGTIIESHVTVFDPPRALAFSWSAPDEPMRPLLFEVDGKDGGAVVTVNVQLAAGEDAAKMAAGFEAHLEMLAAALAGAPIPFPFELFKAMRAAYQAA